MDRIGTLTVFLATATLPWFEVSVCRAQSSASLPSTSPLVQQTTSTTPAAGHEPAPTARPSTHVPPPRAWPVARPTARSPVSLPPPRAWPVGSSTASADQRPPAGRSAATPAVDPTVSRAAQNLPEPLPPSSVPPDPSSVAPDLMAVQLKSPPLEPSDFRFPINLATALRLSDARPLIVAAAQASVWVAEAQLTRAKLMWVPALVFGADYIRHDGGGPDFNKGVLTAPSVNYFYAGGGLNISNSGLFQFVNVTDAYFLPLVAQRVLDSRHADIQTAKNDALRRTADAYFRVHQYRGMYSADLYCVERGRDLVDQIASLSRELVPIVEVERARTLLADLEQQATSARQAWRVPERQPHPGPPAQPPRGGRPARARSSSAHPD